MQFFWIATYLFRGKSRKILICCDNATRKQALQQFRTIAHDRRWKLIKLDRQRQ